MVDSSTQTVSWYSLVVSHDRYLMNQIAQQIWAIEKQDIKVYQGNYDAYRQVKELEMQKQAIEKANYQRQVTKLTKQIQAKKNVPTKW